MVTQAESYRVQLDSMVHIEQENHRLKGLEVDLNRARQTMADDADMMDRTKERINSFENLLATKTVELQAKDEALRQIEVDVREMNQMIESE